MTSKIESYIKAGGMAADMRFGPVQAVTLVQAAEQLAIACEDADALLYRLDYPNSNPIRAGLQSALAAHRTAIEAAKEP